MFENEYPLRFEYIPAQYEVYDFGRPFQIVWRVRKNYVETLGATFQIEERVRFDRIDVRCSEFACRLSDEIVMHGIYFDRRYAACASGCELITDGAGAGEQVEDVRLLVIYQVVQHVEQILLGEIRCRTRTQVLGRIDAPAAIFAAYYSHITFLKYRLTSFAADLPPLIYMTESLPKSNASAMRIV